MRQRGYSDALATGTVAAGGTLGQMLPPSGALIVYGIIAEQSVGKLFTATLIPGISQMLFIASSSGCWSAGGLRSPRQRAGDVAGTRAAMLRIADMLGLLCLRWAGSCWGGSARPKHPRSARLALWRSRHGAA
jgi:TRAP-type C4-dicarboxylate transport system permease large subunit